ncbi:MAG: response regulator [Nitrospinota bacterium]
MDKLKILVADDDKTVQLLYKKGLPEDKFDIKIVGDGSEALETFNSWKPDIVVLDIMMPVKSGYVALKEIRESEEGNAEKTVVIMATAMADKNDIMDCLKLGIQGYMVKPFKHSEIAGKITACYKKARPEKAS